MKLLKTLSVLLITISQLFAQKTSVESPLVVVERTLKALGGKDKINSIQNLQLTGYGYRNAMEQSERFEGPYIPSSFNFKTILDFKDTLEQYAARQQDFTFSSNFKYLVDNSAVIMQTRGRTIPWPQDQTIQDDLYLNPLLIFSKALTSSSLTNLRDSIIQNLPHKRIKFLWNKYPIIISINPNTYLPTMLEIEKPYSDSYLNVWGDLKKVVHYSFWDLLENGVHYPLQKDIYFLGQLWESSIIAQAKINQPLSADSLRITSEAKKSALNFIMETEARILKMATTKKEIAKDVWLIPGLCNSTVIKQPDGLTIIESPNSSSNTDQILEQAQKLFPGLVLKHIITTSDAWLHCGGVRSAALAANVIALNENKKIIQALLKANYKTNPDGWQKNRNKKPSITYVKGRTMFGSGVNRVELIPYRTEAGERMMMAYFPEHKLLYASDLLQPGNWEKHYTIEVIQAVEREKLEVDMVYAMHMTPTKYQEIVNSMKAYLPE